ncbi:heterokaryon incompatibility protein-domain-containing protein [Rhexocercosporidium sp. MPI-PUGE-AT-0058]|nr:heterokaryon incompatibility protein-domain-containing protein [Rhexocercosporidium sp. MPI-PUGE-AT-0058]
MEGNASLSKASPPTALMPYSSKQEDLFQEREHFKDNSYDYQEISLASHPTAQNFCQRCSKFAARLERHLPCYKGKTYFKNFYEASIQGVDRASSKNCSLCRFWLRLHHCDQDHLQLSAFHYWPSATSPANRHLFCEETNFYWGLNLFTLTILQKPWDPTGELPFTPTGKLLPICEKQTPWLHTLNKERIDFEVPRKWLQECQSSHRPCSKVKRTLIPGLKLIDCHTRRIVSDSLFDYVALSYIWGPQTEKLDAESKVSDFNQKELNPLPKTIENAMEVTKEVGFRYLWVDKYCIQHDSEDRHLQIGQMDSIYARADLTIIALGHDPSYGLPGVGSRSRRRQHSIDIGKHTWIYADNNPQEEIKLSKWMTRGWTYQEGLLSKRRLFFTDHEMYFECRGFFRSEAFNFPLNILDQDNSTFDQDRSASNEGIFRSQGVGDLDWHVLQRIEEYSTRSLSKETDIINAFLGIFRAFSGLAIQHHWGVPFSSQLHQIEWHSPEELFDRPPRPLSFTDGLSWDLSRTSDRRAGFPSWSWAGWFGEVSWREVLSYDDRPRMLEMPQDIQVQIELSNGRLLSLEQYTDRLSSLGEEVTPYIHIFLFSTPFCLWRT